MYLYQVTRFRTFINKKSSDINEINLRNLYKKKVCALAFMPTREIGKLRVVIMDEYQDKVFMIMQQIHGEMMMPCLILYYGIIMISKV